MGIPVLYNGVTFIVPEYQDENWGPEVTSYLVALSTGALTRDGGLFTLQNDVDFGGTHGIEAAFFRSSQTNPAQSGLVRLANNQGIFWRNSTNTADLGLSLIGNTLFFDGAPLGGTTWGQIGGTLSNQTDLQIALNLKAPIASPAFTGTVQLPNTRIPLTGFLYGNGASNITATTTIPSTSISGTIPIVSGGTGQTTQQEALNALAGGTTLNRVLIGTGSNIALGQITLSTDAVVGTLPVARGGTGTTNISGLLRGTGTGAFTGNSTVNLGSEVTGNLPTSRLNSGTGATGTTFWRGDGTWAVAGTVTSVSASGGITGLSFTGSPVTTAGTLSLTGTLLPAHGGTGATTLTGLLRGNGTSAITGSSTVNLGSEVTGNLSVANQNSGTGASAATFWRGDGTWATPAGAGTVTSVGVSSSNLTVTGSPITSSGTISINLPSVGALGSFSNANITVDAQGRVTAATNGSSGGVTQLLAGTGISLSPAGGTGAVTVSSTLASVISAPYTWTDTTTNPPANGFAHAQPGSGGTNTFTLLTFSKTDATSQPRTFTNVFAGDNAILTWATGTNGRYVVSGAVTDFGTYVTVPVAFVSGAGNPTTGQAFTTYVFPTSAQSNGTVTDVAITGNDGILVSGSPITTAGVITLDLGAITPASVAAVGTVTGSNLSGTNTGNQTITLTGDVTGSGTGSFPTSLATVNSNTGSFTNANITVNAKGQITAASSGGGGGGTPGGPSLAVQVNVGGIFSGSTGLQFQDSNNSLAVGLDSGSGLLTIGTSTFTGTSTLSLNTSLTATNLSGTNTGNQTITLTGDVTGSGTGSFPATLANTAVAPGSYTLANITVDSKGRLTAASNGTGAVTSVSAAAPVVSSGGTAPVISMPAASSVVNGYLTSANWNIFNNKGNGSVTSVAATSANSAITVVGSPITTSGTLTITSNSFSSAQPGHVPASGGGTTTFLRADGSWVAPPGGSGAPAGSNTQVQFNNVGSFGASSNFTFDSSLVTLNLGNIVFDAGVIGTTPAIIKGVDDSAIATGITILGGTNTSSNLVGASVAVGPGTSTVAGSVSITAPGASVPGQTAGTILISSGAATSGASQNLGVQIQTGGASRLRIAHDGNWVLGASSGTAGQVITSNGNSAAPTWQNTVTSVGLSLPSFMSVSGSPVTSTGTLTGTLVNQIANSVFAGPASGIGTAPTFRSLVITDLERPLSYKPPVRAATTANIVLSGNVVLDGITTAPGERILVKNQTTASQNGIYIAGTGAWTRAPDFNTGAFIDNGVLIPVAFGTANGGSLWQLISGGGTIGNNFNFSKVGAGTGTVTSVAVSGGTTGLFTTGGPITSSGTITLSGTLSVANGGTGATFMNIGSVVVGNGSGPVSFVNTGASGNVLTSTGSAWVSAAAVVQAPKFESQVSTAGQTVFNTTVSTVANGGGESYLQVFVNGVLNKEGATKAYVVTAANQIVFNVGLSLDDEVDFYSFT